MLWTAIRLTFCSPTGRIIFPDLEQFVQIFGPLRTGDLESLNLVTPGNAQQIQLGVVFDAFGDYAHAERMCQMCYGANDRAIGRAMLNARNEGTVDFQAIGGKVSQILQRGITGTEVINGYANAMAANSLKRRSDFFIIVDQQFFGDLDGDLRWINAVGLNICQ